MAKKKTKKPESIRVKLAGERTPAELRDMLCQAIAQLEETHPSTVFKNNNLYLTPVAKVENEQLNTIEIKSPYSSAADEHDA